MKNVIALATGMAEGMGFGDNTKASLITRGLAETGRLGAALGADPMTFAGLAGLGDLVATCSSPLSRNRTFGERLGRGATLEELLARAKQQDEEVAARRVEAYAGEADPYKKPRVAEDELDEDDDLDAEDVELDAGDDRA